MQTNTNKAKITRKNRHHHEGSPICNVCGVNRAQIASKGTKNPHRAQR